MPGGRVAIDRATRFVYVEIHPHRDSETAATFLARFLDCKAPIEALANLTGHNTKAGVTRVEG